MPTATDVTNNCQSSKESFCIKRKKVCVYILAGSSRVCVFKKRFPKENWILFCSLEWELEAFKVSPGFWSFLMPGFNFPRTEIWSSFAERKRWNLPQLYLRCKRFTILYCKYCTFVLFRPQRLFTVFRMWTSINMKVTLYLILFAFQAKSVFSV